MVGKKGKMPKNSDFFFRNSIIRLSLFGCTISIGIVLYLELNRTLDDTILIDGYIFEKRFLFLFSIINRS